VGPLEDDPRVQSLVTGVCMSLSGSSSGSEFWFVHNDLSRWKFSIRPRDFLGLVFLMQCIAAHFN
jgi:hypothetical protein